MRTSKHDWSVLFSKLHKALTSGDVSPVITECASYLGVNRGTFQSAIRDYAGFEGVEDLKRWANGEIEINKELMQGVEMKDNGSVTSDKLIEIMEKDMKDECAVLLAHGFDPEGWTVVSYRHNYWHAQRAKDAGQLIQCQSRVTVRPKTLSDLTVKDIEKFFEKFKSPQVPPKIKHSGYSRTGKLLEICLADVHISRQTVGDKDKSAEEKIKKTVADIVARAKEQKFWHIVLVPLGDIFDVDNMQRTTTRGTQQYIHGTPYQMIDKGAELMIWVIDQLRKIAPVTYKFVPGNHDRLASYALAKILEAYYEKEKSVIVDAGHDERKWMLWGVNLIAWLHGDLPKKNHFSWLPVSARVEWGAVKFAEIHSAHTHTQTVDEKAGQILRVLPSVADSSHWEYGNGYIGNVRSTVSFVWDSKKGLLEQWFTNVY